MQIVVIGGGSVGLLLAGRLALAGQLVLLVTRQPAQAAALAGEPLMLQTLAGEVAAAKVAAVPFSQRLPAADFYFLAVKQPALPQLLPALAAIPRSARVIALQNGLGHEELLAGVLAREQCLFAVNTEGARRHSPTFVEHTGRGMLHIGYLDGPGKPDAALSQLLERLRAAGIDCRFAEAMRPLLWRKLLANALINPLTALYEVPNGALVRHAFLLDLLRLLFREAAAVAQAAGMKITDVDWQDILTICRNTSRNLSSMLQDLLEGRQTEIAAINGYIIRTANRCGIAVPAHEALYRSICLKTSLRQAGRVAFGDHLG
ncbi:ketopantoate reductase family protein [Brevibacillus marinus]|uniref:ketopantoate reductase family protein n=1 Tax=Brevibacillus marinus TaxID=2496837 RepID=UPI000F834651|nr:2-dehydropantoate 2-reductase [Brevibacillus marinus]